jgi:putative salt-induced outer membrane protein YdiY
MLLGLPAARADAILLRGGERLIGRVVAEEAERIRFESQTLGLLEIPRDRVERIEREAPAAPAVAEKEVPPPSAPAAPARQTAPAAAPLVQGQPAPPPATPPAGAPAVVPGFYPWSGLRADQDTFDWIQLKSGEWLKGKIKGMQEYNLDFDSEKLDQLTFKWDDVRIVRSPMPNGLRFDQAGTVAGSLLITADEVNVISAEGTKTYPRADLLAITPTGEKERNHWSGKLTAGLNLRSGNTKETSYNVNATLQRRTPLTRLKLDYLGNFSDINGVTSEENQRFSTLFDYFLSRQWYVRFPDAEYYRDPLQNIKDRLTFGGAVGYDIFRTAKFEWDVSAGPAYSSTRFISVEAGKSPEERSMAGVFSTHLDWQVTDKIEWILDYRGQASGKKSSGGTTQHANSTVEFEVHKRLKLDVSFIWDRVGAPKTDLSGVTHNPDDFRLITSVGVDF